MTRFLIINRERGAFLWDVCPKNYGLFGYCRIGGIDGEIPVMVKAVTPMMNLSEVEQAIADCVPRVLSYERELAK